MNTLFTLPNFLSFLRIPLAFIFLKQSLLSRTLVIIAVAFTDFFDGYLARKRTQVSRVGTILDPISDKFFVMTALALFIYEGRISPLEITAMLCRDFAVILFGIYLMLTRNFAKYQFRSIWCGKITTTLQLFTLLALTFHIQPPSYLYISFVVLGATALVELYYSNRSFIIQ